MAAVVYLFWPIVVFVWRCFVASVVVSTAVAEKAAAVELDPFSTINRYNLLKAEPVTGETHVVTLADWFITRATKSIAQAKC